MHNKSGIKKVKSNYIINIFIFGVYLHQHMILLHTHPEVHLPKSLHILPLTLNFVVHHIDLSTHLSIHLDKSNVLLFQPPIHVAFHFAIALQTTTHLKKKTKVIFNQNIHIFDTQIFNYSFCYVYVLSTVAF